MKRIVLTLISIILLFPIGFAGAQFSPTDISSEYQNNQVTRFNSMESSYHVLYQQGLADLSTLSPSEGLFDSSFELSLDESFSPSAEEQRKPANFNDFTFRRSWGGESNIIAYPMDMAIDSDGNILITDHDQGRIIVLNSQDGSTTVRGMPGDPNLPIPEVTSIWVDKDGSIYFTTATYSHNYFYKVDKNWTQTLLRRSIGRSHGIAVSENGTIYVSDVGGMQTFDQNGNLLFEFCLPGTGLGECDAPSDLTIDSQGNVFVLDNGRIHKFTSNGQFVTTWSRTPYDDFYPTSISIDSSDNIYISDLIMDRVCVFSADGVFLRAWQYSEDPDQDATLRGITVKGSSVFVIDKLSKTIKSFSLLGSFQTVWSGAVKSSGYFYPNSIDIDSLGNSYVADVADVADKYYGKVLKFDSSGTKIREWNVSRFIEYLSIGPNNEVYILAYEYIMVYTPDGVFLRQWKWYEEEYDSCMPMGITVGPDSRIYLTNYGNNRVLVFSSQGTLLSSWGGWGTGDGQFQFITGIAHDHYGRLYVADSGNNRVQVFSNDGQFIAKFGQQGEGDADLNRPERIAIDQAGNIFVSSRVSPYSSVEEVIKVFSPSYQFLGTVVGSYGISTGNYRDVEDFAFTPDGNFLIADSGNSRVNMFTPSLPPNDSFSGLVQNGSFEKEPTLMEWTYGGDLPVTRTTSTQTHGSYSMLLGEQSAQTEQGIREAWAYSNFFVNPNWSRPVLTFNYRMQVNDIMDYSDFFVAIQDGVGLNHLQTVLRDGFQPCVPAQPPAPGQDLGWRSATIDLSAYKGQHIRLVFSNRNLWTGSWGIWTYLDEVKVWDAGYLPPVAGPYENHMPMIFKYHCDERTKGTEDDEPPLRPITPGLN